MGFARVFFGLTFSFSFQKQVGNIGTVTKGGMSSGNLRIIELLNDQQALIKVVNDKDWNSFMQKVSASEDLCMATSTSLLPPRGRFMRLFSQANRACGGVIWDMSAHCYGSCTFQKQQYFAWPSGYYAKTEFNLVRRNSC
jgi:hypothetical protein